MRTTTSTDEILTGQEDARLHGEHAALLRDLRRAKKRLGRVGRLTEAVRAVDAASTGLWIPYLAQDDGLGLSRLEPLLEEMLQAVDVAAAAHAKLVAKKMQREQRRASIKVEEMARGDAHETEAATEAAGRLAQQADYDTDATEGEEDMIDVDGQQEDKKNENGEEEKEEAVVHQRQETPEKKGQTVVTLPPSKDSSSDVCQATASKVPLVERAVACRRFAQTLAQSTGQDVTDPLSKLLLAIVSVVTEADKAFTFPRSGKPRGPIPQELSQSLGPAIELAMDRLLQIEVSLRLAPSMLRFREMIPSIRHRELKQLFTSSQPILGGVIGRFAETLGGMKRTSLRLPNELDASAQDCFALAIDLLTTSEGHEYEKARDTLIDDVLYVLKKVFRPGVLRSQQKTDRRRQGDAGEMSQTSGVLTWAGRVLLLSARIVAHTIATRALLKADAFFKAVDHIQSRHKLFPLMFQSMKASVREAPFAPRPLAPLDLPSEPRRILVLCVEVKAK